MPLPTIKMWLGSTKIKIKAAKFLGEIAFMTIRETTISKLQLLPEPLLQQVSDFIDQLMHQPETVNGKPEGSIAQAWIQWFEAGDHLEIISNESNSDYSQLLLTKYRQQGLEL